MTAVPPPGQPPDDEIERRLAALKAGADPASLGPRPGAAPSGRPDASRRGPGAAGEAGAAAAGRGSPAEDGRATLVGDVIDDDGRTGRPRGPSAPGHGHAPPAPGPGVRVVSWGIGEAGAGRLGLWIGVALAAFGGYLVLAELVPGISFLGSLFLAGLGVVLIAWHLAGRAGAWAVHAGAVAGGFGIARVVADVAALPSAGWGTLGAAIGLLLIAIVRVTRGEGLHWQAWVGGALAVYGGWGVLGATLPGFPTLGDLIVPLVLVLVGLVILRRGVRRD